MAYTSHYPQVVYTLSFVILFDAYAPSLPENPDFLLSTGAKCGI